MKPRTLSRVIIGAVILASVGVAAFYATDPRTTAPPPLNAQAILDSPAPALTLDNQHGRPISLSAQRGHVVIVTFFYTHCPDTCPETAQKLRTVLRDFGKERSRVRVLIVSTDPFGDTRAAARHWLARNGIPTWDFLLGNYKALSKVWAEFHVYAPPSASQEDSGPSHTALMYLIDGSGFERAIVNDIAPAANISLDLHVLLNDHKWPASSVVAPSVGAKAPPIDLASPFGGRVQLASFRGVPVLVNFWATWCAPCQREMALLESTYRRNHGRLAILGIDEQELAGPVRSFSLRDGITYPVGLDSDGNTSYSYEIPGTPTTFFIDRNEVIQRIVRGALQKVTIGKQVAQLLRDGA